MIYLYLDETGYLTGLCYGEFGPGNEPAAPKVESLNGFDLSGIRMLAHRWDGEKLTLDEARLAELLEQERQAERAWEAEQSKETALKEVQAALVTAQINTIEVDDATALRWRVLYPAWTPGTAYGAGDKVQRMDKLYRCLQGHTSQAGWEPEATASLWTEVCESHAGTADDPVPYSGNMALEAGKYYTQDGVKYHCTRDTGIPVYNPLSELVGLYVEVTED